MATPLGLSISDIRFSIDVAKSIQSNWFDGCNGADAPYIEFGRDVRGFREILEGFCAVFETYAGLRRSQLRDNEYIAWNQKTSKELLEVVGDVFTTLEECKQLLEDNQGYISRTANPRDKDRWQLSGSQERAAKLRAQMHTHAAKIDLLEKPFIQKLSCQTDLSNQPLADSLPPIPSELVARYHQALEMNSPSQYTSMSHFPLKEGLEALLEALHQSSANYWVRPRHPEIQQLNNLAKARWIFHCMFRSTALQSTGPESLWWWALESLHSELKAAFDNFGHAIVEDQRSIAALAPEYFRIWEAPEIRELPSVPDDREGEEKILQVPLVDPSRGLKRDVIIFRRPTNELRLVTSASPMITAAGDAIRSYDDEKIINVRSVQIIPRYAFMSSSRQSIRHSNIWPRVMELRPPGTTGGYRYEFKSDDDMHKFQHALLGYKVVHEQYSCQWILHRPALVRSKGLSGTGRIQLWQPKVLTDSQPNVTSRGSIHTVSSGRNSHSNFTLSKTPGHPDGAVEPTLESGDVLIASRPPVPVLVVFTEVEKKPTILHLKLDKSIEINPAPCDCGSTNEKKKSMCKRTILEKNPPKRKEYTIRKMTANLEGSIMDLNLSVFASPRHPEISHVEKIKDVGWLSIDAEDPRGRKELQSALSTLEKIRDRDQQKFESTMDALRNRADRPRPSTASPPLRPGEFARRDSGILNSPYRMSLAAANPSNSTRTDSISLAPTEVPNDMFRMSSGTSSVSTASRTDSFSLSPVELPNSLPRMPSETASASVTSRTEPIYYGPAELPDNIHRMQLGTQTISALSRTDSFPSGPVELP